MTEPIMVAQLASATVLAKSKPSIAFGPGLNHERWLVVPKDLLDRDLNSACAAEPPRVP